MNCSPLFRNAEGQSRVAGREMNEVGRDLNHQQKNSLSTYEYIIMPARKSQKRPEADKRIQKAIDEFE